MNVIESLSSLVVPIDSVRQDPRNVRQHPDRNIDAIKKSLVTYGQRKPIVVNQDGVIEAGNGLWQAAKELGWKEIAAVRVKDDPDHAKGYSIMDNQSALLADWDLPGLKDMLLELDANDYDLISTGFTMAEIESMVTAFAPDEPEAKKVKCPECGHEFVP